MTHRYRYHLDNDGDWIVFESSNYEGGFWKEHARWLIPGTELED